MLTAACSNDDDSILNGGSTSAKMITETIMATNGDTDGSASTRAAVAADASFTWTAGDQVAVHVSNGQYYTTTALAAGDYTNTATFTVTYPDGQSRNAFAVYPASIVAANAANYGQSGTALDVTLPGSYAIGEVSGTTTPCPMIATNTAGSGWTFKQFCGMLRLTVNNIPSTATYLKIDFNGKKVQGAFSIASPVAAGTSTIATSATTGTDDIITITGLDGSAANYDINLPLPTGDYTDVTVTAYNSSNLALLTITRPMKASGTYTAARAKGRKVTAALPVFSVSASKKVTFAPGNLQATTTNQGTNWTWQFAEHQYDYIGNAAGNNSINGDGTVSTTGTATVDLFCWVGESSSRTGAAQYGICMYSGDFGNSSTEALKSDWGKTIGDGNTWRTLTGGDGGEWEWILGPSTSPTPGTNCRTSSTVNGTANARYAKATVVGKSGIIIFPDTYTHPAGVDAPVSINTANAAFTVNNYNDAAWAKMEAAGCVFLPAAGKRAGATVSGAGTDGRYWSSSPYASDMICASCVKFDSDNLNPADHDARYCGYSVRLVREVQ